MATSTAIAGSMITATSGMCSIATLGLADLCTSCNYVQTRIGQYINYLRDLGIAGFRVDAAKHIDAGELAGIMGKIGGGLYSFLEVIGHSGEAVTPEMYYHLSDITEFT